MRFAKSIAIAAVAIAALMSDARAADTPPLTCTFVYNQCLIECGKQQGPFICQHYCTGRRNSCMFTGRWIGRFGDVFENVIRQ